MGSSSAIALKGCWNSSHGNMIPGKARNLHLAVIFTKELGDVTRENGGLTLVIEQFAMKDHDNYLIGKKNIYIQTQTGN